MDLHIYDLSGYLSYEDFPSSKTVLHPKVPLLSLTNLYHPDYIAGGKARVCSNLIVLDQDEGKLLMNCLAKDGKSAT